MQTVLTDMQKAKNAFQKLENDFSHLHHFIRPGWRSLSIIYKTHYLWSVEYQIQIWLSPPIKEPPTD